MSLSTLKPVACGIHPVAGANGSPSKLSKVTMMNRQAPPSLQISSRRNRNFFSPSIQSHRTMVKEKEQPRLQESLKATSRREMVHLTAASVGLLSLLLPASAEARPRNATIRQKIMEKFEELREKAGLSKPKDEGQEKKPEDGVESKSKIQDGAKETKHKIMEKFEELKEKTGLSKPKDEGQEKKPEDGVESKSKIQDGAKETKHKIMEKFEELKEKTGLSKPKDEGQEKKPEDGVESKFKIQDGAKGTKPKDEKKHVRPAKSTVPSTEEPSVPALPSIINGSVETTLP
ncbi:hypothetical protein ACS0TY_008430 [Phlomoides rotata]